MKGWPSAAREIGARVRGDCSGLVMCKNGLLSMYLGRPRDVHNYLDHPASWTKSDFPRTWNDIHISGGNVTLQNTYGPAS